MKTNENVKSADRAANAVAGKQGWLHDIGVPGGLEVAAFFVRRHPDAPAEALWLTMRRDPVAWRDLQPRKRVAVEVFRAVLLLLDRLAAADALEAEARRPRTPAPPPPAADNPLRETLGSLMERVDD